jgi:hypothetical protein
VATVVSVDLAFRRYADIGVALLHDEGRQIRARFVDLPTHGLLGPPDAPTLAADLFELVRSEDASVLLIDGPQAWKDPANGIPNMRRCERELGTPAKTGEPGQAKPVTWLPFVQFSIDVFNALLAGGLQLLQTATPVVEPGQVLVLESFPSSAWQRLGIPRLPAKAKATRADVLDCFERLGRDYHLAANRDPTHDELQALVSGLAGLAIARGSTEEFSVHGVAPTLVDGSWREGFIVNPCRG